MIPTWVVVACTLWPLEQQGSLTKEVVWFLLDLLQLVLLDQLSGEVILLNRLQDSYLSCCSLRSLSAWAARLYYWTGCLIHTWVVAVCAPWLLEQQGYLTEEVAWFQLYLLQLALLEGLNSENLLQKRSCDSYLRCCGLCSLTAWAARLSQ